MNLNTPDSIPTVTPEEFLPPVSGWLTGGGIALLTVLGGATVLAALLPYPVTIKAAATVRPDGDLRLVEATLRAPVTGVIQDLALRNPGQVLSAGEVVAHLAPAQAPLLVKALVNQNDISQIKPGQAVTLRIDRGDNHATEG